MVNVVINKVTFKECSLSLYLVLVRKLFLFCYLLNKYDEKHVIVSFEFIHTISNKICAKTIRND